MTMARDDRRLPLEDEEVWSDEDLEPVDHDELGVGD